MLIDTLLDDSLIVDKLIAELIDDFMFGDLCRDSEPHTQSPKPKIIDQLRYQLINGYIYIYIYIYIYNII